MLTDMYPSSKSANDSWKFQPIIKKQINYKFKSTNGQLYSRHSKMKKLVKNIFSRYQNENIVFSIFPMKGKIDPQSSMEIEIYCFGKQKLKDKDKLIIGNSNLLYTLIAS